MHDKPIIYDPSIFDKTSLEEAKSIVLTPEGGVTTQIRWDSETPWLLNLIRKHIKPAGLIIDFGCGVGRMSAPLVNSGYPVIGIDASGVMRQHATNLIANDRFVAMTPAMLDQLVAIGVRADTVLAIWVLQHCLDFELEIERLYKALNRGGVICIADMRHRAVPTSHGWVNDGSNVREALSRRFSLLQQYAYNPENAPNDLRESSYVAFFQKNH